MNQVSVADRNPPLMWPSGPINRETKGPFMATRTARITAVDDALLAQELEAVLGKAEDVENVLKSTIEASRSRYEVRSIVTGFVVGDNGDRIVVDVGYKSEGVVKVEEFSEGETEIGT
jgi:hypothetical protein